MVLIVHRASNQQTVHRMLNVGAGVTDHDSDIFLVVAGAGTWAVVATGCWDWINNWAAFLHFRLVESCLLIKRVRNTFTPFRNSYEKQWIWDSNILVTQCVPPSASFFSSGHCLLQPACIPDVGCSVASTPWERKAQLRAVVTASQQGHSLYPSSLQTK
jgi:hypothetical protein